MTKKEWYNYVKRRSETMRIKEQLLQQERQEIEDAIKFLKDDLQFNRDFISLNLIDENLFNKDELVDIIYDNIKIHQRIKKLNKRLNELTLNL